MRTIEKIIEDWKMEFGLWKGGEWGRYQCIEYKSSKDLILNLAETLKDEGYRKEDLYDEDGECKAIIQMWVVDACHAPKGVKSSRKASAIKITKDMIASHWRIAIERIFNKGPVSTYVPKASPTIETPISTFEKPKKQPEKEPEIEKQFEIDPNEGRANVDTTGFSPEVPDLEFLAELGINPPSEDE